MFRFQILKAVSASLMLLLTPIAVAQDAPAPQTEEERALQSMRFMLQRAELVRMLAAEHLQFLNENRNQSAFHLLEEASQVMAYNLICADDTMDVRMLNNIAAQSTLQVATLINKSPINDKITEIMGQLGERDRLILMGDISSTVVMFKIGRRRGLFDALLTDFGAKRFCAGMGNDMRRRYNGLVAGLSSE
ncbi:hypothetical protein [Kordiimonas sp.]|uniref:hypothetical protein n=1 Tax=Kordiimonas sp. TaxID=1970157 RepID=UPI003A956B74